MLNINDIRSIYPEYNDLTDYELSTAIHRKRYPNVPYEQFAEGFGGPLEEDKAEIAARTYNAANPQTPITAQDIRDKDRSGLWGSVQLLGEGIYNAVLKRLGMGTFADAIGKRAITRIPAKVGAEVVEEQITEGITYFGEEGIRQNYGLRPDAPSLGEFAREQAGPVAVGSLLQLGGMRGGQYLADKIRKRGALETVQPQEESPLVPETDEIGDVPFLPEGSEDLTDWLKETEAKVDAEFGPEIVKDKTVDLLDWTAAEVDAVSPYAVTNKTFESTVLIPRTAIEDDQLGTYTPLFSEMGYAAATHPDELVFGLLGNGTTALCYDGKPFFAADHPVYPNVDGTGSVVAASNLLAPSSGAGAPWYLLDVSRPLKPFIFQERTLPELKVITTTDNEIVFLKDQIPYGVRYRCNGGYGFWQQAVCSTEPLNIAAFEKAIVTMQGFKADGGRPLGIGYGGESGILLVVPPTLQAAAKQVLAAEKNENGASNIWYRAATVCVSPWL